MLLFLVLTHCSYIAIGNNLYIWVKALCFYHCLCLICVVMLVKLDLMMFLDLLLLLNNSEIPLCDTKASFLFEQNQKLFLATSFHQGHLPWLFQVWGQMLLQHTDGMCWKMLCYIKLFYYYFNFFILLF